VFLEGGPLSLLSKIEELLGRKSSGSDLENREYGRRRSADYATSLYPRKFALTSATSSLGRYSSLATQATEFVCIPGEQQMQFLKA
jgi:hypothetical protein